MWSEFTLAEENDPIQPSDLQPFVVLTRHGQPVGLRARHPFAGSARPQEAKTAALLVLSSGETDKDLDDDSIRGSAREVLLQSKDAEGVIVVSDQGRVRGVISADTLLIEGEGAFQAPRTRGAGYEPLPGLSPGVPASAVYSCPVPGCPSPDVVIWQKGRDVPPCPYHGVPRQLAAPGESR